LYINNKKYNFLKHICDEMMLAYTNYLVKNTSLLLLVLN